MNSGISLRCLAVVGLLIAPWAGSAAEAADPAARYAEGRDLLDAGSPEAALPVFDELVQRYPGNADYVLARGITRARLGRDAEALADLDRAIELAPDYEDAWRWRHRVLARGDDATARLRYESLAADAAERFPDATWWLVAPAAVDAPLTSLLVGAGYDSLSNDAPSWNQQFVEWSREQRGAWRLSARMARDERFDESDVSAGFGGDLTVRDAWTIGGAVAFANDPAFQPETAIGLHAGRPFGDGWVVDFGFRQRDYPATRMTGWTARLEHYTGDWRFAWQTGLSRLDGASYEGANSLTADWYYGDGANVGATVNAGTEAEAIAPGNVLETDVRGFSLHGRHPLADRFALHWWLGVQEQGDYYRRRYVGLAVSLRL